MLGYANFKMTDELFRRPYREERNTGSEDNSIGKFNKMSSISKPEPQNFGADAIKVTQKLFLVSCIASRFCLCCFQAR